MKYLDPTISTAISTPTRAITSYEYSNLTKSHDPWLLGNLEVDLLSRKRQKDSPTSWGFSGLGFRVLCLGHGSSCFGCRVLNSSRVTL